MAIIHSPFSTGKAPILSRRVFSGLRSPALFFLLLAGIGCDRLNRVPPPPGVPEEAVLNQKAHVWDFHGPDGRYIMYYSDGSVAGSGRYLNGSRTGEWKTFFQDGTVASVGDYRDDWRDGKWIFNDDEGLLYLTVDYKPEPKREFVFLITHDYGNENGVYERFFPGGKLEERGMFRAGYFEGPVIRYNRDGTVAMEGQYHRDESEGLWKYYYPGGSVQSEENYKNGQLDGPVRTYYPDGSLYQETVYKSGNIIDGPHIFPHRQQRGS